MTSSRLKSLWGVVISVVVSLLSRGNGPLVGDCTAGAPKYLSGAEVGLQATYEKKFHFYLWELIIRMLPQAAVLLLPSEGSISTWTLSRALFLKADVPRGGLKDNTWDSWTLAVGLVSSQTVKSSLWKRLGCKDVSCFFNHLNYGTQQVLLGK